MRTAVLLLLTALAAPAALAQPRTPPREVGHVSAVYIDTTASAVIRALEAVADSAGLRLMADSSVGAVRVAMHGAERVRIEVQSLPRSRAIVRARYVVPMPLPRPFVHRQLSWIAAAYGRLFPEGGRPIQYFGPVLGGSNDTCGRALQAMWCDGRPGENPPRPQRQVSPDYPDIARRLGLEASVMLHLAVDDAGKVTCITAVSAAPHEFSVSAVEAVRQWVFQPFAPEGTPTGFQAWMPVTFRFR